ncbi:hypothetical protein SRO_6579 [Streptomyces rochei]|nr:hypothetical protein SRO_6579 [Streptomyces rochei]
MRAGEGGEGGVVEDVRGGPGTDDAHAATSITVPKPYALRILIPRFSRTVPGAPRPVPIAKERPAPGIPAPPRCSYDRNDPSRDRAPER